MRKQDRIANQHQQGQSQPSQPDTERTRGSESERMRGSKSERMQGSESETQRPQRQSGKLPLPD